MLLNFIFILLAVSPALSQRSCSRDRMRQCEETLRRNTQRRVNNMNSQEMTAHCIIVRDDFNCLLRETRCLTSESERNRNGDTIRIALKYIRDGCDTPGSSWRDSTCYVGDSIKSCESSYPLGGIQHSSYSPENCRKFNLFQTCVMDHVRSRCRADEERFLGQYLVDSGQDLAWNCGEPSTSTSTSTTDWDSRNRDDRYDRYDRNNGDRNNGDRNNGDRSRDRDSERGRDPWRSTDYRDRDRDRDRDYSRDDDRNRDRYSDRYDRNNDRYNGNDRYGSSSDRYGNSDVTCCRSEKCSTSRLQLCRDSLTRTVDSRTSGYQDSQKCRKARDDFNCLLWQTSTCLNRNERDQDNDLFSRARDYISRNCDSYGRWSENSCYKSSEMQRCENNLSLSRGGANYESCRAYNNFRDCMQDELQRRCTREDELYQGAYLVDKAQELSWQCGNDNYNGRDQYLTDRRDPYDSRYDSKSDSNYGAYNRPTHLDDDDAMCSARIQSYSEQCKVTADDKRKEIHIENDYERRQKIICCAAHQYRSCLFDATRRVCQQERSNVVNSLMGRYEYDLSKDTCRRIYDSDCNSGNHYQMSHVLMFVCTVILSKFFIYHL